MADHDERLLRALDAAERGDLRPQFNPGALLDWRGLPAERRAVEPILVDRFFQLSRPIADASAAPAGGMRLQDAGRFFYLVETLQRLGYQRLEETLLVILDEFFQFTERGYDELYLWSIVQLSRLSPAHVERFWPPVIELDCRYRPGPWQRPAGVPFVEQPYQLTELLFDYFVLYTLPCESQPLPSQLTGIAPPRRYPSLGACLLRVVDRLTPAQLSLAASAVRRLAGQEARVVYRDALGLLAAEGRGGRPRNPRRREGLNR